MIGQIHLFDVYVPLDDSWVKFNASRSPLKGRFCHNTLSMLGQIVNVPIRAEDLAARRLQYPSDFDMPDNARVWWLNDPTAEGLSSEWVVQEGTESGWHGIGGTKVVNTCQVNRTGNLG